MNIYSKPFTKDHLTHKPWFQPLLNGYTEHSREVHVSFCGGPGSVQEKGHILSSLHVRSYLARSFFFFFEHPSIELLSISRNGTLWKQCHDLRLPDKDAAASPGEKAKLPMMYKEGTNIAGPM